MAIVWPCPLSVENYVAAGDKIEVPRPDCPRCSASMSFWGSYERDVRLGEIVRIVVRRARCTACSCTHALLPDFVAHGRLDGVEVIGEALQVMAAGNGARPVAIAIGVAHTTARSWQRRFSSRAVMLAAGFCAVIVGLGDLLPRLPVRPAAAALVAMEAAVASSRRRLSAMGSRFRIANRIVGGHLISTNTDLLYAGS